MAFIKSPLICHGIKHDHQRSENDPKQSVAYLWHQLHEFGQIHCMSFCAACQEREPLDKHNVHSKVIFQDALDKVHQAFGALPIYIYNTIPNIDAIKCPACTVYHALAQYPFLATYWGNCLTCADAIPCFWDTKCISDSEAENIEKWESFQKRHIDALIGYSSNLDFPRNIPSDMHPSALREIRSALDCGQEIVEYIDLLNNDILGAWHLEQAIQKHKKHLTAISQVKRDNEDDDEQRQIEKRREEEVIPDPPGSVGFWAKRDLALALPMLGWMGVVRKSIYETDFPDGFWYKPAARRRRMEDIGRRISPLITLREDIETHKNHILPYVKYSEEDGSVLFDSWYVISWYDAITLHTGLDHIAKIIDDDNYFELYAKHFSILKKEAIDGTLYIPFGRDIFLNAFVESDDDIEKHHLIVLDVNEFFKYIIERAGIPQGKIPGAVISRYEEYKLYIMSQEAKISSPVIPDSAATADALGNMRVEDPLILDQLATIAGEKAGWKASKPTTEAMRLLMEKMNVPVIKIRANGREKNAYSKELAMPCIEKWAQENKPPLT